MISDKEIEGLISETAASQHPMEIGGLLEHLQYLIDEEGQQIKNIVDIGAHTGGTCAIWKRAFPDATVVGVEFLDFDHPVLANLVPASKKYGFSLVQGSSCDEETLRKVMDIFKGEPIDFIFIDGDHAPPIVKADYALWSPYAKYVGFHDISLPGPHFVFSGLSFQWPYAMWKVLHGTGIGLVNTYHTKKYGEA